jgi:PAP2 superfamily protein
MITNAHLGVQIPEIWLTEVTESLRAHRGLAALILVHAAIALATAAAFGGTNQISLWLYGSLFSTSTAIIGVLFLIARSLIVMVFIRPDHLIRAIITDLLTNYLTRRRLLNGVPIIVLLSVFNSVFTSVKALIPVMHPYNWDTTLMTWDQTIHFGLPPWRLLQPVLATPVLTGAINVLYNSWFLVLAGCWFWQAFTTHAPRQRMQFFVTFVLSFALLGNLAATLLASGGPCFYGHLVSGPDPFGPLLNYLREANLQVPLVWSIEVQESLWNSYAAGGFGIGSGISAMPSMHLAGATLFALLGWRTSRTLGIILTTYAGIIMLGSVHLGWHYAIDGYVAIIGTMAIWYITGAILGRDTHEQSERLAPPYPSEAASAHGRIPTEAA